MASPPSHSAGLDFFNLLDANCPSRSASPDLIDPTRDEEHGAIDITRDDKYRNSHFEMGIIITGLQVKSKMGPRKHRKRTKKGKKDINKDGYVSGSGCDKDGYSSGEWSSLIRVEWLSGDLHSVLRGVFYAIWNERLVRQWFRLCFWYRTGCVEIGTDVQAPIIFFSK